MISDAPHQPIDDHCLWHHHDNPLETCLPIHSVGPMLVRLVHVGILLIQDHLSLDCRGNGPYTPSNLVPCWAYVWPRTVFFWVFAACPKERTVFDHVGALLGPRTIQWQVKHLASPSLTRQSFARIIYEPGSKKCHWLLNPTAMAFMKWEKLLVGQICSWPAGLKSLLRSYPPKMRPSISGKYRDPTPLSCCKVRGAVQFTAKNSCMRLPLLATRALKNIELVCSWVLTTNPAIIYISNCHGFTSGLQGIKQYIRIRAYIF